MGCYGHFLEKVPAKLAQEVAEKISIPVIGIGAGNGVDGQVLVRILVGTSGEYLEHTIVESPHEAGTNAVSKHIPELKFTPAMKNGKPVKVWVNVPFNFKLLP